MLIACEKGKNRIFNYHNNGSDQESFVKDYKDQDCYDVDFLKGTVTKLERKSVRISELKAGDKFEFDKMHIIKGVMMLYDIKDSNYKWVNIETGYTTSAGSGAMVHKLN